MIAAIAVLAALPSAGRTQALPTRYTVTDLGTLGGERSSALAVNDNGQVVGFSTTTSGATRAFLYEDGAMQDLGTLGGGDSLAYGISSNGTVVGRAQNSAGEFQAFVRVPGGRLMDIPGQNATFRGPFSTATAVSKGGRVVGYRLTPGDHMVARSRTFLFTNSVVTDLGPIEGHDVVIVSINDGGQFVGFYGVDAHADYADRGAFIGQLGGAAVDLGSLGGRLTTPTAINEAGQATGFGQLAGGESHAFLFAGGRLSDLGTLNGGRQSFGYGIDDLGNVVGASDSAASTLHAFLYTANQIVDLNTLVGPDSGWVLTEARDINTAGVIVGSGIVDGRQRAYLLTPVP